MTEDSPKLRAALAILPPELHKHFRDLLLDYKSSAWDRLRTPSQWVSYVILADLVLAGWRASAPETKALGRYVPPPKPKPSGPSKWQRANKKARRDAP